MNRNYAQSYAILGLRPGDNWHRLRSVYRRQIRKWHPDRFFNDATQRRVAEETTKTLNSAYRELSVYYKQHGALPLLPANQLEQAEHVQTQSAESTLEATLIHSNASESRPSSSSSFPSFLRLRKVTALALVAFVAAYFLTQLNPADTINTDFPGDNAKLTNHNAGVRSSPDANARTSDASYFTVGATLGDVYAIQGTPSKTEGDAWFYGDAKVYFHDGRVIGWVDSPLNPLRARQFASETRHVPNTFTLGSSKEEVRRLQGEPLFETDAVWDYGVSRIYFRNGRVIGWFDSPMNPLRVGDANPPSDR